MFPIPFNFPFRKKDGSITTMDDAISSGGGSYTLPTASADTKGGVKIGDGLTMTGETLSANSQLPAHSSELAGKVLTVGDDGSLEWDENGGGVGMISRADWNALTTAQKQSYGLVIIVDSATGFIRGDYVNGADYTDYTVKQTYQLTNYEVTRNGNIFNVEFTPESGAPSGTGIVIAFDDISFNTAHIHINTENVSNAQIGICTIDAELPNIVTQGAGRVQYSNNGDLIASFNPLVHAIFIVCAQKAIDADITLSTV